MEHIQPHTYFNEILKDVDGIHSVSVRLDFDDHYQTKVLSITITDEETGRKVTRELFSNQINRLQTLLNEVIKPEEL